MLKSSLTILSIALLLPFISCDRGKVYSEYQKIPDYVWERDATITFSTDITDPDLKYDFALEIRHLTAFPYKDLIVVFRIIAPSGASRSKEYSIPIRADDGSYLASGMGDLWDLSFPLMEGVSLDEAGTYTFEVDNVMPRVRVTGLMEIGMTIRKSNQDGEED